MADAKHDQNSATPAPGASPEAPAEAPALATAKPDTASASPLPTSPEKPAIKQTQAPGEVNGPSGPEPTRYGDWERKGIVSDF